MQQATAPDATPRYRAFISYSHADSRFAQWLHRKLEAFRLPKGDAESARLAPVFIDRAELAAGPDLSQQVREALAASAALIVVASPAAQASRWVAQEIELFRALHPDHPVLAALIGGEPDTAFPQPLVSCGGQSVEPLAADFRANKDGKRLGLIKIVAGLTALPLDQLVQRDVQTRQRRVMVVTAGALTLSLVLAGLLIVAVRERSEAQRQRATAEGMVEFMLTDLRDKLKGVGRIEIMDAVNQKAMDHYSSDSNLESLPADVLQRRARLLTAMGEDDNTAGRKADARRKFAEAYRVTEALLKQSPNDPQRIFNHAQSEYWLGNMAFLANEKPAAQPHWNAYLRLAKQLVAIDPHNIAWQRELGYAHNVLCAVAQAEPADPQRALAHCRAASQVTAALSQKLADDIQVQLDHSNDLGWLADAELRIGNGDEALAVRQRQRQLTDGLPARFPKDARALQAQMLAAIGLGTTYRKLERMAEAHREGQRALAIADLLRQRDPMNKRWAHWRDSASALVQDQGLRAPSQEGEKR